jgi:hypothetical protein
MSIKSRLEHLETLAGDEFCPACMVVRFRKEGEPESPPVCPECGRHWPDDYPPGMVREFVVREVQRPPDGGDGAPPKDPEPHDPAGAVACVPTDETDVE